MTSATDQFKTLRQRGPNFGRVVYEFNYRPASYLHPSRRADLLPDLPARLWTLSRLQDRLSLEVLDRAGIDGSPCMDVPNAAWVLALLPTERVSRLASHIGALAAGARVRASLSREQVLGWKAKLGKDAYRFAMTSASLLAIGKLPELALEPVELGYGLIATVAQDMPDGIRERFMLKLPLATTIVAMDKEVARRLVQTAINIIEGEWCSFIAPIES